MGRMRKSGWMAVLPLLMGAAGALGQALPGGHGA